MEKRGNFGSSFGVLVAMAGSAVGLGNLWRFPYLVGTNGGAAFICIYLCFVFLICLPIMFSEFIIGRRSHANAIGAFKVLAPHSKWGVVGIVSLLGALFILSFYSVVGGWTINYLIRSLTFSISSMDTVALTNLFEEVSTTTFLPIVFVFIFLAITALIVIAGVEKGIEKYTKIMMPALFIMVIIIAVRSITLPGAGSGLSFLFKPDFSKINGDTFLAAMGQAFFSLSLGCGTIMTYASYVKKNENIIRASTLTAISDTIFAIIAGVAIMPAVFAFNISPTEGPGLVFKTLPFIFNHITGGSIISILFFFILFIAAITSSISLLEVAVAYMKEEFKMSRKMAALICTALMMVTGTLSSLSQGVLSDIHIFGLNFFDFFDYVSSNILMPIGGLLVVLFVGWRLDKAIFLEELSNSGKLSYTLSFLNLIRFIVKFLAPVVIAIIMISGIIA